MRAFSLVSWLKQQLDGPAWKQRRRRHFFQPQLTVLEDRVAPAAFTVTTLSDTHARNLTTGTDITGRVSLRSAIEAANHLGGSNTISLAAETYDLTLGQLAIKNNLTLTGMGQSSTTINAQYTSRIFQVFSGFTVAISKVTMEAGLPQGAAGSTGQGGAIFDSGALTLTNDTLFQNLAIGGDGADGAPGANGANETSTGTPPTNGGPGGNGQQGGDAKGGAVYLDKSVGAKLSIVNCALTGNEAFQGSGGSGGQGGTGGNIDFSSPTFSPAGLGGTGGAGGSGGPGGNAFGGAIYNAGGALVVQGSLFSGNFAGVSGFLFGNVVGGGSGGAGGSAGNGEDNDSNISNGPNGGNGGLGGFGGNGAGGGIYNSSSGSVTITASSFSQNSALGERGGPGGAGATGGSYVAGTGGVGGKGGGGGSAGDGSGGAIDNQGTMTIDNSSFFKNQALGTNGGQGGTGGAGGPGDFGGNGGNAGNGGFGGADFAGAIESFLGSLTLTHSTLSLNSAGPGAGGTAGVGGAGGNGGNGNGGSGKPGSNGALGLAGDGGIQSVSAKSHLFDTIVAGDTAPVDPDVGGHFLSLGHNLIGNATGSSGFTASGDQVGVNPMLGPPGNHGGPTPTMVPMVGSPAIDAGDNANAPATDQRGLPRIVDGDSNVDHDGPVIDIGAVEFQPTNVRIAAKGSTSSVSPGGTLTYTITVSTGNGDSTVTKLALSDSVPAQTTLVSFTVPTGWIVTAPAVGQTVTAIFASLGQKAIASFTLVVKVDQTAGGSTLTNTATIATTSPQSTSAGKSATVKTTVTQGGGAVPLIGPLSLTSPAATSSTDLASDKVVVDGTFAANDDVHGSEPLILGPTPDSAPVDSAPAAPVAVRLGVHGPKNRPDLPGDLWSEDLSNDRLDW